jgi:hypothetical protein
VVFLSIPPLLQRRSVARDHPTAHDHRRFGETVEFNSKLKETKRKKARSKRLSLDNVKNKQAVEKQFGMLQEPQHERKIRQ